MPAPVVVSLPIRDRVASHAFYRDALGLEPVGEPADDGVPEPLQFELGDGVRLMLVPADGFGWVLGGGTVAAPGTHECVLGLSVASPAEVDATIERATGSGASVVTAPGAQPWGYAATFADLDGHLWLVAVEGARSTAVAPRALDLFAEVHVRDHDAAVGWYERLLGAPPSFVAHATESVWQVTAHGWLVVEQDAELAGRGAHTIFLDDLDAVVAGIAERGIEPAGQDTYDNGVRKVTYRDLDGNELGFGGAPA